MTSPASVSAQNTAAEHIAHFAVSGIWRGQCRTDVRARHFAIPVAEPAELGGDNSAANPMELLLAGLEGCLAVVIETIAREYGAELRAVNLSTQGTLDVRGFLGQAPVQPYFQSVYTRIDIDIDLEDDAFAQFAEQVEARCPAGSLLNAAEGVDFAIDWIRIHH